MSPRRTQQNADARDRIRHKILTAHSPGEMITENELMSELGLNRTPVREALASLQGEGLIEILPKKGTLIRKLGHGDVVAILDLRRMIETRVALRLAAQIAKRPQSRSTVETELGKSLQGMRSLANRKGAIDVVRTEAFWASDIEFHATICVLACYQPAAEILRRFQNQLRLVALKSLYSRQQLKEVVSEHSRILDAILAGATRKHRKAIAESIRIHLRQSKRRWFFTPLAIPPGGR